jgi:glutamine synthetase type III
MTVRIALLGSQVGVLIDIYARQISAEQAALTFQLAEKAIHLNSVMCNFHTEIARATSQRATTGQRELQDLAQKILLLQKNVQKSVQLLRFISFVLNL